MQSRMKLVFTAAILVGLLAALLPTNTAWAGLLYQTVPTAGPSPTVTAIPPNVTLVPSTSTATRVANSQAPTSVPPQPATSTPLPPSATLIPTRTMTSAAPTATISQPSTTLPALNTPMGGTGEISTNTPDSLASPTIKVVETVGMIPTESAKTTAALPTAFSPTQLPEAVTQTAAPATGVGIWVPILMGILVAMGLVFFLFFWKRKS